MIRALFDIVHDQIKTVIYVCIIFIPVSIKKIDKKINFMTCMLPLMTDL